MNKTVKASLLVMLLSTSHIRCGYEILNNNLVKYAAVCALIALGLYNAKDLEGLDIDLGAWRK